MITFPHPPSIHDRVPDTLEDPGCPPLDAQLRPPEIPFRPPISPHINPSISPPLTSTDHCDLRNDADETFLQAYRRLGAEPFKALLYPEAREKAA